MCLKQLMDLVGIPVKPPPLSPRFEAEPPPGHQQVRSYRNWNPPLLGNLPDDFLRILPQQLDSIKVKGCQT